MRSVDVFWLSITPEKRAELLLVSVSEFANVARELERQRMQTIARQVDVLLCGGFTSGTQPPGSPCMCGRQPLQGRLGRAADGASHMQLLRHISVFTFAGRFSLLQG